MSNHVTGVNTQATGTPSEPQSDPIVDQLSQPIEQKTEAPPQSLNKDLSKFAGLDIGTMNIIASRLNGNVETVLDTPRAMLAGLTAGTAMGLVLWVGFSEDRFGKSSKITTPIPENFDYPVKVVDRVVSEFKRGLPICVNRLSSFIGFVDYVLQLMED